MKLPIGTAEAAIGRAVDDVDTPALLIDADALEQNIVAMANLTKSAQGKLRPHCKTHKSSHIARMQISAGAHGVCCAKLSEAMAIANGGADDVYVTTPVVGRPKLEQLRELTRLVRVTVVADNAQTLADLAAVAEEVGRTIDVIIEVDVGQGRCGVSSGSLALPIVKELAGFGSLRFRGLHGYQGKLQMVAAFAERRGMVKDALQRLFEARDHLERAGHAVEVLTGGGSGSIGIDMALNGLNEYQPGSYVFMDASYRKIEWNEAGAHSPFQCALTILGRVVSLPESHRAIIDVGWKSASSDSGPPVPVDDALGYEFAGDEHGIVKRRDGGPVNLSLGQTVPLIPSHCDTTVNLYSVYHVTRLGSVQEVWSVDGRGCSQ